MIPSSLSPKLIVNFRKFSDAFLALSLALALPGCGLQNVVKAFSPPPAEAVQALDKMQKKDLAGATALFDTLVRKAPDKVDTYLLITSICSAPQLGQNRNEELAARYAEQGIKDVKGASKPEMTFLLLQAATARLEMGQAEKGVEWSEKAYQLAPDDPIVMNALGYALAEATEADSPGGGERLARALKLTTDALNRLRENPEAAPESIGTTLDSVGWTQYKQRNFDEALPNLMRAIYLSPDQPEMHYHLAMAYRQKQRYAEAVAELKHAIQMMPGYRNAEIALQEAQPLAPSVPAASPSEDPGDLRWLSDPALPVPASFSNSAKTPQNRIVPNPIPILRSLPGGERP